MAPTGKVSGFRREGDAWFCNSTLPSDILVVVDEVKFHLHKFPLISRCGKIAAMFEESESRKVTLFDITLEDFPGGADVFLNVVKFCYGSRLLFTPQNTVILYCAAEFLDMTDDFGEDNLQSKLENFFHQHILNHWKDCAMVLQSCEAVLPLADKLRLSSRCIDALSVMICTDSSLFGWPMKMYGSLQSPGGSILWNGINTGAKIHSDDSNWWFADVSCLCVELFERLIHTVETKGVSQKIVARAIMYYCVINLPGLCRWQGEQTGKSKTTALVPVSGDQKFILETVIKLLPEKRGKSLCRFLLGLLRVSMIVGVNRIYLDSLERRIGIQLEFATLDGLLIPSYSDSETLYDCDCVERMLCHFVSPQLDANPASPLSIDQGMLPLSQSQRFVRVSKLVDQYLAEIASDANLKPGKFRRLTEILPDSSRTLYDGVYRAVDIYLKEHAWMSEKDQEQLCTIIDFQKLSIDACEHASQNGRLPMRVKCQALFFEQMHLRVALAGYLNSLDSEIFPQTAPTEAPDPRMRRDRWLTVSEQNEELKIDMERMMSRVDGLEQEVSRMKEHVRKVKNHHDHVRSSGVSVTRIGCKLLPPSSESKHRQDAVVKLRFPRQKQRASPHKP